MKVTLLFLCGALLLIVPELGLAGEERAYGQYLCHIEGTAGINYKDKQPPFAGTIRLPESELTFGVTVRPIARDDTNIMLCKQSFEHFLPMLEKGLPYKPFDAPNGKLEELTHERRNIGWQCLTKDEALLVSSGGQMQSTYRSYDYPFEFYGLLVSDSFSLYGNGTFQRSISYDSGPVLAEGHCVKMPEAK